MLKYKNRNKIFYKAIIIALLCLFCADSVVLAAADTLAPSVGNPRVYQEMRNMMEERFIAHQDPIDEFIKQNAGKAKNLSAIPYLEEEFARYINASGANNMLTRLKTTLTSAGGKIQVIFVKSEDELPLFNSERAWGHAGVYVTVFALESEKDSKEGRRKMIARLFHEIRARATRAKELFDEELKDKTPNTPEEISAFIRSMRERFEKVNLQLQLQIEENGRIANPLLSSEFASLTFAIHPHEINRDYMMGKNPTQSPDISNGIGSSPIADYDNIIQELEPMGIITNRQANILQKLILPELWERRMRVMMAGLDEFVYPAGSVAFNLDGGREQLKLIKQDFTGLIKEKSLRGDYKFTIYQVGLGKTAGETEAIIQAFKEAFEDPVNSLAGQNRDKWVLEVKGIDVNKKALDNANLLKDKPEYSTDAIKINMVFIPVTVLNRKALEEFAGSDKADYVFYRYVGYPNQLVNNGWLNLEHFLGEDAQEASILKWPDMLNIYLSLRNISLALGKPGSRIVVEPIETNEFNLYKRVLNLPGASILLPDNPRSGIYKINDLKAFPKLGFAGFLQMQPLSLNVSSLPAASSNLIKLMDKIEGLGGKIELVKISSLKRFSPDYYNKIIELDLNDFFKKSRELERYQDLRYEILLFANALLDNVEVAERENMAFAIKESIQNAFVHGSKANPNYPIFIRLNISENNQLLSTEIYNTLSDKFDPKALKKARQAKLFGPGEGEKGIKEVVGFKREELKDEAGSIIGAKVTLIPPDVQGERVRGASSMEKQSASSIMEAQKALPKEWREYDLKTAEATAELSRLLQMENLLNQDKSTFIFSEKVTFDNGLGVFLPKITKSGMKIAVIATNDKQRALIDELNQGKPEDERIIYADTIADVRTKIHTARYYYFKVTGDPDTDLQGVTTFDITELVKKIIDALGKLSGIVERERLELLHEAARKFAEAA